MKYTTGIWIIDQDAENSLTITNDMGEYVCEVTNVDGDEINDKNRANANLIATSKDLLECVQDAISDLSQHMSPGMKKHFQSKIKRATS